MNRTITRTVIAAVAALALTGCAVADTEPDQKALVYNGGPLEDRSFNKCIPSSTLDWEGIGDTVYYYPSGQRYYVFDTSAGADTHPLSSPSKDNIMLTITGQLRFELNTDCDTLREFHEKIGRSKEWTQILDIYLKQPLDRAVTEATQELDWLPMFAEPAVKAQWEKRVLDLLPEFVEQSAGGKYFHKFGLTLQKPELPSELNDSLLKVQSAIQQTKAQEEENRRIAMETDGIKEQIALLGPDNYVIMKAIESGKVSFMPIPENGTVMIAPK